MTGKQLTPQAELALLVLYEQHPEGLSEREWHARCEALVREHGTAERAVAAVSKRIMKRRPLQ